MSQSRDTFRADLTGVLDMPGSPIRLFGIGVVDCLQCEDKIISQHRPGKYSIKQLRRIALNYLEQNGYCVEKEMRK